MALGNAINEDSLTSVIQAFAEAAIDPSQWLEALQMTGNALGAVCCCLEFADLNSGMAMLESPLELGQDVLADYNERIFHINPRVSRALRSDVGTIVGDPDLRYEDDPHTPEFLDWLAKTPTRYLQGSKLLDHNGQIIFYTANYSKEQGAAGMEHRRFHEFLVPQLVNFLHVGRALNEGRLRNELVTQHALDGGRPFALLDKGGNLMECSAGFEAILRANILLDCRNSRLVAKHSFHRQQVERFLRQASSERRFLDPAQPVRLAGPANPKGLVLRAVPLPPRGSLFDVFHPAAMLTLTDLDQPMKVQRRELIALFGLTEREADVAALLGEGKSTESTALQLGISQHTVRQHIKAVFSKIHIERQAELVALLARLT